MREFTPAPKEETEGQEMADREVTCKKCNVTNVGSTVYQALFDLKHDNSAGCNKLVAEYTFKDLQGEDIITGSLNCKGVAF